MKDTNDANMEASDLRRDNDRLKSRISELQEMNDGLRLNNKRQARWISELEDANESLNSEVDDFTFALRGLESRCAKIEKASGSPGAGEAA
jgi:predicted  nucleic acid-binding Zn-ribbon protein